MTSAEKVAALRRQLAELVADRGVDPKFATLLGVWEFLPAFMKRRVVESMVLPNLDDAVALDDLLSLIAGVALELQSDDLETEVFGVDAARERARELLGVVQTT